MTKEISLEIFGLEHQAKQPIGFRYAVLCEQASGYAAEFECDTKSRLGSITNCQTFSGAVQEGEQHEHSVIIRFYPTNNNRQPSSDFLEEQQRLAKMSTSK